MTNRTADRFAPRGTLTPDRLNAYAGGQLDARAAHAVELHLQADPLLQDAADGLSLPGAMAGLDQLAQRRPKGGGSALVAGVIGGVALVGIIGITLWWYDAARIARITAPAPSPIVHGAMEAVAREAAPPLTALEIETAVEIAETLRIGHAATERHVRSIVDAPSTIQRSQVYRVAPRTTTLDPAEKPATEKPKRATRSSVQLMYLHDLKLVDPTALYANAPVLIADADHLPASFADRQQQARTADGELRMGYTPFMDAALEKFVRNDHKGCLEELRFLLKQYPDDVNALFYAGLCCYDLGLNSRAREFFQRAATHSIRVFDEEAVWYHALTLQRLGEKQAAMEAFARIAAADGFYAERAKAQLGH